MHSEENSYLKIHLFLRIETQKKISDTSTFVEKILSLMWDLKIEQFSIFCVVLD